MPINAQSADGVSHEFPDGTDQNVINRVMKDYAQKQPPQGAAPEKPGFVSRLGSDIGQEFSAGTQQVRAGEKAVMSPDSSIGQRLKGAGQVGLGAMGQLASPISGTSKAIVGDPIRQAIPGRAGQLIGDTAEMGAGMLGPGGAIKGVRAGTEAMGAASKAKEAAKVADLAIPRTAAAAKDVSTALYKKAAQDGGVLTPEFTGKFADSVSKVLPQTEAGKMFAGKSAASDVMERVEKLRGRPLSLDEAQEIDEEFGNLIDKEYRDHHLSKDGQKIAEMQRTFRDSIENAEKDEIGGGKNGFSALKQARQAWSQSAKFRDLERIQARAELSPNPTTTTRSSLRTLLSNPTRLRGYSPDEVAALRKAASSGTLDKTLDFFGSRLTTLVGALAGHGVPGALVGHGVSEGARAVAGTRQARKMGDVMRTIGSRVPKKPELGGVESLGDMP